MLSHYINKYWLLAASVIEIWQIQLLMKIHLFVLVLPFLLHTNVRKIWKDVMYPLFISISLLDANANYKRGRGAILDNRCLVWWDGNVYINLYKTTQILGALTFIEITVVVVTSVASPTYCLVSSNDTSWLKKCKYINLSGSSAKYTKAIAVDSRFYNRKVAGQILLPTPVSLYVNLKSIKSAPVRNLCTNTLW